MSSPPKTTFDDDAAKSSSFTTEGLPRNPSPCFGTTLATTDVGDGGPSRRIDIDCRPTQLISAPSIHSSKTLSSSVWPSSSLTAGPVHGSLMDDDDDDMMDYFGSSGSKSVPLTSPSLPATTTTTSNDILSSFSRWNVRDHNVPNLPSFYPLEKSAVFVPHASAPILSARIANVLQVRSIAASYDAQTAKVDCVSKYQVEFRIRLYRGRAEYNHGIIVEVQRRAGFDLSYTNDANAILDAAEGKSNNMECSGGLPSTLPYYQETKDEEDIDFVKHSGGVASLRLLSHILCPKNKEAVATVEGHCLAMASLASLTSLDRMGPTAVQLSNELLTSDAHADLRHSVFSHVSQDPKQISWGLMIQSLEILANVANNCTHSHSQLADLLCQDDHVLLEKLIANVENALINPHACDLSCRILRNICVSQEIVEELIAQEHKERLFSALTYAVRYGNECHADLQRHSQCCLDQLL